MSTETTSAGPSFITTALNTIEEFTKTVFVTIYNVITYPPR